MITSLAVAAVAGSLGKESFAGHRVLRCVPRTADATVALGQIAETFPLTDWWLPPVRFKSPADLARWASPHLLSPDLGSSLECCYDTPTLGVFSRHFQPE